MAVLIALIVAAGPSSAGEEQAMTEQAVRVERSGPVSTVFLHRPARRNAVDGPTAAELAAVFRAFDADPDSAVAVLHGEGGVFCSGADLTAIGTERGNRVAPDGDGPMGVSRLRLSKPVIAAVSGYAVGRRPRAGPVVRPAGGGRDRHLRRLLPALGRSADRRRHRAPAPAHRDQPGDGHDPHRTRRRRPGGGGDRSGQSRRPGRSGPEPRRRSSRPGSPRSRRSACAATVRRCWIRRAWTRPPPWPAEFAHGRAALAGGGRLGRRPVRGRRGPSRILQARRIPVCVTGRAWPEAV